MIVSAEELTILMALDEDQRADATAWDIVEPLGTHETKLTRLTRIPLDVLLRRKTPARGGAEWQGLIATLTDLVVGGWLVDALIQRGWNPVRVRQVVLIGGTSLGLGILGTAYTQSAAGALLWISISIGGLSAAAPVGWSIPSLISPKESVGTVGGILNFSNQLAAIAAPIVTGYVVQATQSFAWAFVAATAVLLMSIAAYIFLLGGMEPVPEPA